ncbi:MAG: hypothetical protein U0794_11755 [Isosphaeraceae bacterium]
MLLGELDLNRLLAGPDREFDFLQYILSGSTKRPSMRSPSTPSPRSAGSCRTRLRASWRDLYERTGGSSFYLRLILWSPFDRHHASRPRPGRDSTDSINQDSNEQVAANIRWNARLRYVHGSLESDPDTSASLEQFVHQGSIEHRRMSHTDSSFGRDRGP